MSEEKLQELFKILRGLTYTSTILGEKYKPSVISSEHFDQVETAIRQFLLDNHDSEYGELQAKVYAYEKIIANSNFAPMIDMERVRENMALENGGII